ncbi:lysine exporter LysO family protein [Alkaliflexus imshenetskii]|uniref:lysine exporter LysO family protein n=1 Tax=Alkaliflexus imshenetskii TaxID=286730 RepID=UPI00047DCC41|nr:lysine exporter LysO family protein [Alkaliflexus imshenetskii]
MKSSLLILLYFVVGIVIAYFLKLPIWFVESDLSAWALYLLMFIVGISVGSDPSFRSLFKRINWHVILVPLSVIVGSLSATAVVSYWLYHISVAQAMAVGAGFGYYSLSAVLIAQMSGQELGVVALLANIIREVLTLAFAPLLVRFFGRYATIAAGGATAMDTTLPVVVRYSGKDLSVVAIFTGVVLSLLVPLLVPFLLTVFG